MTFDKKKTSFHKKNNSFKKSKYCKVRFYGFSQEDGSCFAEADLPESGETISGIHLTLNNSRVSCEKPYKLTKNWPYKEMSWEEVSSQVTYNYNKMRNSFNKNESNNETTTTLKNENRETNPVFTFTKPERKKCAFAQIIFDDTHTALTDVFVQTNLEDGTVYVAEPKVFENAGNFDADEWKVTASLIESEFRRQVLNETIEKISDTDITFTRISDFIVCACDVQLHENKPAFRGFKLKLFESGKTEVAPPISLGTWNHPQYSWNNLRADLSREFKNLVNFQKTESNAISKPKKEENHYGRIKNAERSDFAYFPHSMLRPDTDVTEGTPNKNLSFLASALSKGPRGGIGPFEINALWWISKLRYVTSMMLLELAAHGYISLGWRDTVSKDKLSAITKRMCNYNMIVRSRFCCIDENGDEDDSSKSVSRIMTLAPNGSTLLKELGKDTNRYNPFTVLQDGNTIKRYLVANQWLIYWLKTYKERIGENYESAMLLQRKGEEFTMARAYASVTVDNVAMVAEPIRRVDEFEVKENRRFLIDKLVRMIKIFEHPDQIYCFDTKIDYPSRPIIVLLCEDDEHIKEVAETLSDLVKENPEQEFWFSTDLRVFNEDHIGERFLKLNKNSEPEIVDMAEYFGRDEEVEKQILIDKFTKDSSEDNSSDNNSENYPDEFWDDEDNIDDDDDADSFVGL